MPRLVLGLAIALAIAAPSGKQPAPEPAARELAGLGVMPASIDQVIGVDVARLVRSPLVRRAVEALLAGDAALGRDVDALFGGCHIDVGRDVARLWLGRDHDGGDRVLLVVEARITEGQLNACVGKAIAPAGGRLSGDRVAGRTHYHVAQVGGRPDVWFAVVGDGVVAVATSAELLVEATAEGPRLAASASLASLIERAGAGHAVWFAGAVPPTVGSGLAQASGGALSAPRAMFGHLDLDGAVAAELGVVMASEAEAKAALSIVNSQLKMVALVAQSARLGQLVNRITSATQADSLILSFSASEDEVREAVSGALDSPGAADQNAAPEKEQGVKPDGQGDPDAGDEAPVR